MESNQTVVAQEVPSKVFPLKVPCVVGRLNAENDRITVVSAELPAVATAQFYVDSAMNSLDGFQRGLDRRRADQIGKLQLSSEPYIQGGLLAYGDTDDIEVSTRGRPMLTIKRPLKWLDGQHRGAGDRYAIMHGRHDYTECVRIEVGGTLEERISWYLTANMTARKTGPGNVLYNVSNMEGTQRGKKSWIARIVRELSGSPPFKLSDDTPSLVNWVAGARNVAPIQAGTLYRATDLLLPPKLNAEGRVEAEAIVYAHKAWTLYSDFFLRWGALEEDGQRFVPQDAYSFTMLVAYARLHAATEGHEDLITRAFELAQLAEGIPPNVGSGEKAASNIAAIAAGSVGVDLRHAMVVLAA